jgi:hypothetical protein
VIRYTFRCEQTASCAFGWRLPGQLAEGIADVAKNIAGINRGMPPKLFTHGTGFSGDVWVRFDLSMRWWRLDWRTTTPGVIQYNWSKLNDDQRDEATIIKGVQEGRYEWVDLTEADMQKYAAECEKWSQMYAVGAQKLYNMQMATEFVVEILGNAAMVLVGSGLGPGKKVQQGASTKAQATSPKAGPALPAPKPSPGPSSTPSKPWVPPPEPPRAPSGARPGEW